MQSTKVNPITILAIVPVLFSMQTAMAAIAPGPFGNKSTLLSTPPVSKAAIATSASTASTAPAFGCGDLRRAALNMSAHASNLANRQTTRTTEGGAYKRLEVVCKSAGGAFCNVEKVEEDRLEYQPGHPDANPQGYVKYPVINTNSESAGLNIAASELKLLASREVCGAKIIEQGSLAVVKYHPDFDVMMDTITFTADGSVSRWSRTTRDGKTQSLSFKSDGTTTGL